MPKVVLTGGTFAGKSTLIDSFKSNGFKTLPDIGYQIILDLNNSIGVEKQKQYRQTKPQEFYKQIIERQLELENAIDSSTVILDRGALDYIAMMLVSNITPTQELIELASQQAYDLVFVCETLESFENRDETGRTFNKESSIELAEQVERLYLENSCDVVFLKEMAVDQRYKTIERFLLKL